MVCVYIKIYIYIYIYILWRVGSVLSGHEAQVQVGHFMYGLHFLWQEAQVGAFLEVDWT